MRLDAALRAALESLPTGFEVVRGRRGLLVVRAPYREALLDAGLGPDERRSLPPSDLAGRVTLGEVSMGAERLLVRPYEHGGLLRWSNRRRFADPTRPLTELAHAEALERRGIDTPLGVGARLQRAPGLGWNLALVTRRVEGTLDVERALRRLLEQVDGGPRIDRLVDAVGAFVGRLHAEGFEHTDLTPRNLLVEERWLATGVARPRLWLLDLDRCAFRDPLADEARHAVLARLLRYLVRRDVGAPKLLSRTRCARFLAAYARARDGERYDGAAAGRSACEGWRELWQAVGRRQRRTAGFHRLGWRLEELFGADAERGRARVGGTAPRRP